MARGRAEVAPPARRRRRFDQDWVTDVAVTASALILGVLLLGLGHAIRTFDDHLADFDDPTQEAPRG